MSSNAIIVLMGWLLVVAIFLGCIVLLRYLQHRERMELIKRGFRPNHLRRQRKSHGILRAGLITMMVGFWLTVGLYPVGFLLPAGFPTAPLHLGPWLLPGLIPFGVGLALAVSYYLEQNTSSSTEGSLDEESERGEPKDLPREEYPERDIEPGNRD
jgi:hypothetical protein